MRRTQKRKTKQFTFRIDGELMDAVHRHMEKEGISRSEAFDQALWMFLQEPRLPLWQRQMRAIMCNALPLERQKFTLALWVWLQKTEEEAHLADKPEGSDYRFMEFIKRELSLLIPEEKRQAYIAKFLERQRRPELTSKDLE